MSDISMDRNDRMQLASANKVTSMYQGNSGKEVNTGKTLPVADAVRQTTTALDAEQVQEAVSRINDYVQQSERSLEFRLDENSGETIIRVYDKSSEELIRQIPSELALELAQKLNDEEPSLLFSAQV